MTTASAYISTSNTAIPDLDASTFISTYGGITYDRSPEGLVNYLTNVNGNTFLTPFIGTPIGNYISSTNYSGITLSIVSQRSYYIARSLPISRRGIQPQTLNNVIRTNWWQGDQISVSGRSYNGYTGTWSTVTLNNSYPGMWPTVGICQAQKLLGDWLYGASANGVTFTIVMVDNEATDYEPSGLASDLYLGLKGDTRYYQTYFGLSSWADIYAAYGGSVGAASITDESAWWAAKDAYQAKIFQMSWLQAMLQHNSKGYVSNYKYFKQGESPRQPVNMVLAQDARILPSIELGGNAGAPELYGGMRQSSGARIVKQNNGTKLDVGGFTNYFRMANKAFRRGPWASFILTLTEARSAKRGSPNTILTPWVGSVDWYGPNYIREELVYPDSVTYSWGTYYQSPAEVLNTTWYRNNVTVSSGFTAYDGSTAAFRITTPSGITSASLSYYVNNMTMGVTYIFSYYTNLDTGLTSPSNVYQDIRHFKTWTYNLPRGITFERTLPSVTGPFYQRTAADYSGYTGWQKIEYKFRTIKPFSDISDNLTVALSVFGCTGTTSDVAGKTAFFSHPELQIEGVCGTVPLFVRSPTDVYNYIDWLDAPASGFSNLTLGYNPRQAIYITSIAGHSGYWYDYLRHLALMGTKYFGYFNPSQFVDMGYTGAFQQWINVGKAENSYFNSLQAFNAGWTAWLDEQTQFNNCLKDINQRLGGFTLTTADYSDYDWNSTYMANGAPSLNGTTWWWRVTVKPGYTMICDGVTLSSGSGYPVGTWISATGPTLAGIGITWTAWPLPSEPGYTAPNKVVDFVGMTYNNRVKEVGFNLTRSTTATYIGSSGYLMTAAVNEPRLDYDPDTLQPKGLLLEAGATNFLNWSETFATSGGTNHNWVDFKLTRTTGNTSPSGNTTAIRFTATGGNATLMMTTGVTTGVIFGSWSCWFRGITGNENLYVTLDGGTSWTAISGLKNTWKRFGSEVTETTLGIFDSPFYLGFKLGNTNDSVEIWGAQVEERRQQWGAQAKFDPLNVVSYTSYVPSGSSRGTRSFDNCQVGGSSLSSWYGFTQGTLLVDAVNLVNYVIYYSASGYTRPLLYSLENSTITWRRYGEASQSTACDTQFYLPYPQSGYPLNYSVKSMVAYWPYGLKASSYGNLSYTTYSGITSYVETFNTISFSNVFGQNFDRPRSSLYLKKMMYWNYLWSDSDMKAMTLANVEPITSFNPNG